MHRFFVPSGSIQGDAVTLTGDIAQQLARVLRSRPGDRIVLFDGSGSEHFVTLEEVSVDQVRGVVDGTSRGAREPDTVITLYQGVLKTDRFEFVLQKGTELGVSNFVPMLCARSIPRVREGSSGAGRRSRWQRIITEAAEQSGRARIPALARPLGFSEACGRAEGLAIMPWELEDETGLKTALSRWKADGGGPSVSVLVGPEGGFTQEEADYAGAEGVVTVTLGSRVLRAETAGIATVAAVLYELGELGG